MILYVIILYFIVLLGVSRMAASRSTDDIFFRGGRQSPWYMVAFGMIGASISGVTFVSVPGMVIGSQMTYLQTCMGFIFGYILVAYVLLPIYYRMELTTIYSFLKTINVEAYKTGALFFIFSKLLGSAAKFFVPCYVLSSALHYNFYVVTVLLYAFIWLYTRRGGIKALVWTDSVQTLCMIVVLLLITYKAYQMCEFNDIAECFSVISSNSHSRIFQFDDWNGADNFFKCFIAGIFIVIVMTGLDQDMMQKNLTCRTLRDAQKDMCTYGFAFLPVNFLFLVLGVMLTILCTKQGMPLPKSPDGLMTMFALNDNMGTTVFVLFTIGIIATSSSTVDSALTSLTTTFCVDVLPCPRKYVHTCMAVLMILCTMAFRFVDTTSLINTIYTLVSYTYGPLLGLFSYALVRHIKAKPIVKMRKGMVFAVCVLSPVACYILDSIIPMLTGYHFGYELLLLNGVLTYIGLCIIEKSKE